MHVCCKEKQDVLYLTTNDNYKHVSGVGLLQHYIRVGKTRDDIVKITYQFCVSLNIQPARVCEGITELFGVCFKT